MDAQEESKVIDAALEALAKERAERAPRAASAATARDQRAVWAVVR